MQKLADFAKLRFAKNVCFRKNFRTNFVYFLRNRKTQIFANIFAKTRIFFAKMFVKTKNADFRETFCKKFCESVIFFLNL
jgi:hypothetical protein